MLPYYEAWFFIYISNRIRVKLSQLEGARSERVNKLILTLHSIPLKLNSKSICPIFSSSEKNIFNMKVSHKQKTFHSFLQILKDLCIKCERLSSCCRGSVDQDNSVNPRWMQHPESNKDTFCYKYFPNRCYDSTWLFTVKFFISILTLFLAGLKIYNTD